MTEEDVLAEFHAADALLEGHFVLSSGLHSSRYLQCARVLMDAGRGDRLCHALADKVRATLEVKPELVVSPAMGGVVVGYEMGRQLSIPAIFTERVEGEFTLRRGFEIPAGTKCLMVEDVVSTGLSSRECIATINAYGGVVVGACSLVDRSGGTVDLGVPYIPLVSLNVPAYEADKLPPELQVIPAIKPGSRGLKA